MSDKPERWYTVAIRDHSWFQGCIVMEHANYLEETLKTIGAVICLI